MFMYIFFPSGILTMIMVRTLRKDIARYNRDDDIVSQQFAADLSEFYDLKGKEKKNFKDILHNTEGGWPLILILHDITFPSLGRDIGGDRMETGPWGRLQTPQTHQDPGLSPGGRDADLLHGPHHYM